MTFEFSLLNKIYFMDYSLSYILLCGCPSARKGNLMLINLKNNFPTWQLTLWTLILITTQ